MHVRGVCVCVRHLPDVEVTLESMLKPRVATLPGHIQSVYVQNICKLYGRVLAKAEAGSDDELVQRASRLVSEHLALFVHSADLEVQERVSHCCTLLASLIHQLNFLCSVWLLAAHVVRLVHFH